MLSLDKVVQFVVQVGVVVLGACQKSPQPARKPARRGTAASNNRVHLPILIAAPSTPSSGTRSQGTAWVRILSCCTVGRTPAVQRHERGDAGRREFACR